MDKFKTLISIKKFKKIVFRSLLGLILLLLVLGVAVSLPQVQTKLAQYLTEKLNKDFNTDINVERIKITVFGSVKLQQVFIRDHHKDTLIYAKKIQTNILSFKKLYNGDLFFGDIRADGLILNMKIYKGEKDSNLDLFIEAFDTKPTGKPSKKFLLTAKNVYLTNSRFILTDNNLKIPKSVDFNRIDATLNRLKVEGPDVTMFINRMAFRDFRGLYVSDFTSDFTYTKTNILLKKLKFFTEDSNFDGDVALRYIRTDFSDFNNKVKFDIDIKHASIATNDIAYFYKELGADRNFDIQANIQGTLNDFNVKKLRLKEGTVSEIAGDVNFKNLFGKQGQDFYMKGSFEKVISDYRNLTDLLPNILGNKLPTTLAKIGRFNVRGDAEITTTYINADVYMTTALGNVQSNLKMNNINNIDNASYSGNIILEDVDLGKILDRSDIGRVSLNVDVDGKGFTEQYLDTKFTGDIYSARYNNYNYKNIIVNGNYKKPVFTGEFFINDPNLFMDFDGSINLGRKETMYDFHTKIDYANLRNLNFVKNDSIAIIKGDITMNVVGNTIDDMQGMINISEASYQNNYDTFLFNDFIIESYFEANKVRTITIDSPDIISGKMVGKYEFGQLRKMVENSLGSLYANYVPNKVKKGQFLNFNFTIYNKIIELFYPGISLSTNTVVDGSINSDNDEFKLNFNSPRIDLFNNIIDKVSLKVDNKNPLYNAYIAIDSIKTSRYKISDFQLLNVTARDTLFVRTEFKGGKEEQDYYNLNLYHTIDKTKNSVIGFAKSEMKFKDYLWYINEKDEDDNKVVFDKALKDFALDNIVLSHENQQVVLDGTLSGKTKKDLNLTFTDIDLYRITPELSNLKVEGSLNGEVSFVQNKDIYKPTASLTIDSLKINEIALGKMMLDVSGDKSFQKFYVKSTIDNQYTQSFKADGSFEVKGAKTTADIDLRFAQFNLGILSSLGGEVITDIRGLVSGTARIEGDLADPEINGRLFLDDAGLTIPYLNVNYELDKKSIVDVTETSFIIRNSVIKDTKYNTVGFLNGRVRHSKFDDWKLDLEIKSSRLLALDTGDSDDAAYYGTAFIDGVATISGPTNGLFIKVNAKSEKGTNIKIPINNSEAVGSNSYIHFLSPQEKYDNDHGIVVNNRDYNGLELEFDFDITPDAEVEVILDKNTGHGIRGKGFGSLLFKINTLGKFNMWGDFQAYEGVYNFKYGGLIDKKFNVKKGGSIVWEGDPMRAVLNLEAVYKTTANPAVLLENASFNKKIPVEVLVGIRGSLSNPEPDFQIEFPTVSSVLKSEIEYKLNDKDTRQTQALYLLSSGGFLSPEGVSQSDFAGNFFERASGLFNDIFQDADGKFVVGIDYVSADKRPGIETDGRFGFAVSTHVNDRISINGKVGVPVGGINETAIVGDVEILYRVNADGSMNLRVFNRENDISYIGEGIAYTQGIGITYEVDFNTFKQLVNRIFKNIKLEEAPKKVDDIQDSEINPDYINFNSDKKKKKKPEVVKPNHEARPPDE